MEVTDEYWQAIIANNSNYDGKFFYAVKTTKIFCKPSCPSRPPKRENITIYPDSEQALKANFRPCKRCRPLNSIVENDTWVKEIDEYLNNHFQEKITLKELASQVHGSPSYLRHTYQDVAGITPQERISQIRLKKAEELLTTTDHSIQEIAQLCGFSTPAYFIQQFKKAFKITPKKYQLKQKD